MTINGPQRVRVHSFLSSTRSHPTWRPLNYLGRHFSDIYNAEIFTNIWEAYRLVYWIDCTITQRFAKQFSGGCSALQARVG